MASPELQTVLQILRGGSPIAGSDVLEMRANMEAGAAAVPVPEGVRFTPVDAGGVPAEWADAEGARPDRALVYFHGGGYVMGSLNTHRGHVARISRLARMRVLSADYRLAPEHPHPACVEDAVAAVDHALAEGIDPKRLAVGGDSAGGGLTLACLIALRDRGGPLPAAGCLISAWTDLTGSGDSTKTRTEEDPMVKPADLALMAESYVAGGDPKAPLASPLFADLSGLPPLLAQVGTAEILLDDSTRLAERARAAGVEVELRIWEDMFHVWHAFAEMLPEGVQAVEELAGFLEERLAAA